MHRLVALFALVLAAAASAVTAAAAAERFPILQPDQMNAEQKKLLDALLAGPRGGGDASPEADVAHVMPPDGVPLPLKPLNGAQSE